MLGTVKLKRCRGIIIWDFDGVFFDFDRFKRDTDHVLKKYGVPFRTFFLVRPFVKERGFSLALLIWFLRKKGIVVPERVLRKDIHGVLALNKYLDPNADQVLHRLRRRGFVNGILSFGQPSFQYKKIYVGCGRRFLRHFVQVRVTGRAKFHTLRAVRKSHPSLPIFFVDDTQENIALVKKHIPSIIALHYRAGCSLKDIERKVISCVKRKGANRYAAGHRAARRRK